MSELPDEFTVKDPEYGDEFTLKRGRHDGFFHVLVDGEVQLLLDECLVRAIADFTSQKKVSDG